MTIDPSFLGIHELHDRLRSRDLSAVELAQALFDRIEATDGAIGAYLAVCREQGMEDARRADARLAAGDADSKLLGIPVALKDVLLTEGVHTTCASKILDGFTPPYDGTAVRRLKDAGAVVLGKTNMDEFAMGSSTENSGYSITRNPWNPDHVPGGSSGGSAAAVAAGQCIAALGTDTGGSIRQPASFCGIVGLKPTYGRVSRYGVVAYASSLDQVGPMTRDVTDCALMLQAIAGHDPADSTSVDVPVPDYGAALTGDVKGLKIGVPKEYFATGLQPEVEQAVRQGIAELEKAGAVVTEVSLPRNDYAVAAYYVIAAAEASSNLARYDGMRYGPRVQAEDLTSTYMKSRAQGFGHEVKRRIMLGTYVLSAGYYDAYYLKAQKGEDPAQAGHGVGPEGMRRHRRTHLPHHRLQGRRDDPRPAADVPVGHPHHLGQPGRVAGTVRALRLRRRRPPHRHADHRPALRRGHAVAPWPRLRADDGVAYAEAGDLDPHPTFGRPLPEGEVPEGSASSRPR